MMKIWISVAICLALSPVFVTSAPSESESDLEQYDLLKNMKKFIDHFGHDAVHFLRCMGPLFLTHCSQPILDCLGSPEVIDANKCIAAIKCEGHDVVTCIKHLVKEHQDAKHHPETPAKTN